MPYYKTPEGKQRLSDWYDRFQAKIPGPVERREVATSVGPNRVLLAGDPSKPPLVCLHGAITGASLLVSELPALLPHCRIVAPDIPGQSVVGPETSLSLHDDSIPKWLGEILDGLGIDRVDLLGVSWGGFVAHKFARSAPGRVRKMVLIAPAGLVGGAFFRGIWTAGRALLMFRLFPNDRRLADLLDALATDLDDDWRRFFGDAFREMGQTLRPPPLAKTGEFAGFTSPTLLVGAGRDVSFPGKKLVRRIKRMIPHAETVLNADDKHMPPTTDEYRRRIGGRIVEFLR